LNTAARSAFTRRELVVVIAITGLLMAWVFAGMTRAKRNAEFTQCARQLKSVGLAFRQWSVDSSDTYPMLRPTSLDGSLESATNGSIAFTFVVMSNEINTPKILVCPADTRRWATSFGPDLANSNISYFVGITADETQPWMLLLGDRNLTNGPLPANRLLLLTTNSAPGRDQQLHKFRGNIALSDGSVQSSTTPRLRTLVTNSGADNLLAFP